VITTDSPKSLCITGAIAGTSWLEIGDLVCNGRVMSLVDRSLTARRAERLVGAIRERIGERSKDTIVFSLNASTTMATKRMMLARTANKALREARF